jgi:hypothetical protein
MNDRRLIGLPHQRSHCGGADGYDHRYAAADEIGRERRELIELVLHIPILDRHVPALDIAGFLQARWRNGTTLSADWALSHPITGTAACCARATTGHAAVLPSPAMNSRLH